MPRTIGLAAYLLLLAVLVTWPLATRIHDGSLAAPAEADLILSQYLILWGAHALSSPEAELPHTNMFHPARHTFGYSDMPVAHSLLMAPVIAAGATPDQMYNLFVFVSLLIGGLGTAALARRFGLSWWGATAAATVYVANPAHLARYVNPQLFGDHWLPWLLWATLGWLDLVGLRGSGSHASLGRVAAGATGMGFLLVLHALSGSHNAVFGALLGGGLVAIYLLGGIRSHLRRTDCRRGLAVSSLVVIALVAACLLPVFGTYMAVYEELSRGRFGGPGEEMAVLRGGSAGARELLSGASDFWLTADREAGWPGSWLGRGRSLRAHLFPGLLPLVAAAVGLASLARPTPRPGIRRAAAWVADLGLLGCAWLALRAALAGRYPPWAPGIWAVVLAALILTAGRAWLHREEPHALQVLARGVRTRWRTAPDRVALAALLGLCLTLAVGPEGGVYWLLRELPGVGLIRAPSRFWLPALVLLACLAGYGIDRLRSLGRPLGAGIAGLLLVLFLAEAELVPLRVHAVPYPADEVNAWLADRPEQGAILEVPVDLGPPAAVRQLIRSTAHWRPLLIGYSGSEPPGWGDRMRHIADGFPEPATLTLLRELGVRWVIVDRARLEGETIRAIVAADGLESVARFGPREIFELR